MSLVDHEEDLSLKSPVITDKDGLHFLHHLKAAQSLIKMIKIYYCFGLGNDKLQVQLPFYY